MLKGVSYRIKNTYGKVLDSILSRVCVEDYNWFIDPNQTEIMAVDKGIIADSLFEKCFYDGKSFREQLQKDHYVVFLKLVACDTAKYYKSFHTYKEFFESDCAIILMIHDCEFVEIYAKDELLVEALFSDATKHGFTEVSFITESNDSRILMDIL